MTSAILKQTWFLGFVYYNKLGRTCMQLVKTEQYVHHVSDRFEVSGFTLNVYLYKK